MTKAAIEPYPPGAYRTLDSRFGFQTVPGKGWFTIRRRYSRADSTVKGPVCTTAGFDGLA